MSKVFARKSKQYISKVKKTKSFCVSSREWWEGVFIQLEEHIKEPEKLTSEELELLASQINLGDVSAILFSKKEINEIHIDSKILCEKVKDRKIKERPITKSVESLDVNDTISTRESRKVENLRYESQDLLSSETESSWEINSDVGKDLLLNTKNFYRPPRAEMDLVSENLSKGSRKSFRGSRRFNKAVGGFDFEEYVEVIEEQTKLPEEKYWKMYGNFMKKEPSKAAIWRPHPPVTFEEMSLVQKANAVTEKIAKDFIEWMQKINSQTAIGITTDNLIKMFEIGSQTSVASAIDMKMHEMPSLPTRVANSMNVSHLSKQAILRNEISKDIRASKRKPKILVFGSRLPPEEQVLPHLNDTAAKWHQSMVGKDDIIHMDAVFKGITHLRSIREFAKYMRENKPKVARPRYLVKKGLFNKNQPDNSSELSVSSNLGNETKV